MHDPGQLPRLAEDVAEPRWTQRGFGATAQFRGTQTPRNLIGQKDGTGNPQPGTLGFDPVVWVQPGDYIVGDVDGVVVVPAAEVDAAVAKAYEIRQREEAIIAKLKEGGLTLDLLGMRPVLKELGLDKA
mgnify:CR=1 FL=1